MKDLIPVTQNKQGQQIVSAKDLYLGLGLEKSHWKRWSEKNIVENEYFQENIDWVGFTMMANGNETQDFAITLEFAKHIAMMARTGKSHQYRNYFIECERRLKENKPQLTKHDQAILNIINSRTDIEQAIAIKDFEKVVTEPLHDEIKVLKPKAHYTDIILQNKGLIKVTSIAKDYGMSAQEFNKLLCDFKIQYRLGNQWFLYKKYQNKGYTHSETINYKHKDGRDDVSIITKWTQKGRLFLYEFLKEKNILPIIEKDLDLIR